jgi:hypothetical protein
MQLGTPFMVFIRYNAQRGEHGLGEVGELAAERGRMARIFRSHNTERTRQNGQVIAIRGQPFPNPGFITLYSGITTHR